MNAAPPKIPRFARDKLQDKLRPVYEEWQRDLAHDVPERDIATLARTVDRLIAELSQNLS